MSHKFLPFITDTSPYETIFKNLIQRSKGVSSTKLSCIYGAILEHKVSTVKKYIASLPDAYTSNEVLDAVATHYHALSVPISKITFWLHVVRLYGKENLSISTDYSFLELGVMFSVLAERCPGMITQSGFDIPVDDFVIASSEDYDPEPSVFKQSKFSSTAGRRIGFECFEEFKAFLLLRDNTDKVPMNVLPVLVQHPDSADTENLNELYLRYNCSPSSMFIRTDDVPF